MKYNKRTRAIITGVGALVVSALFATAAHADYTYDFSADTVGQVPANTSVDVGTFSVVNNATLGTSLNSGAANHNGITLNNFAATTDYSVVWKEGYIAGATRHGFVLRAQSTDSGTEGIKQGYLFQVFHPSSSTPNTVRIAKITTGGSPFTQLASVPLTSVSPRWFKATVSGSTLTLSYSTDGVAYTQIATATDSTFASGGVQYVAGVGLAGGKEYVDNVSQLISPAAPALSSVKAVPSGDGSMRVTWVTKDMGTSQIEYGLTTSYGSNTAIDSTLAVNHIHEISGLTPKQTYQYRVKSTTAGGVTTVSPNQIFTVPAVVYSFTGETVGQTPNNVTVLDGEVKVATQNSLGTALRATAVGSSANAQVLLNSFPSEKNYAVTWREKYVGTGGKHGFILRAQTASTSASIYSGLRAGYFFQVGHPNSGTGANAVRVYRIDPTSVTQIANSNFTTGTSPRYYRASVNGPTISVATSENGTTFTQLFSVTDGVYASGGVAYAAGLGGTIGTEYVDDISLTAGPSITNTNTVTTANSATISWTTDQPATSQVLYGATSSYGSTTVLDSTLKTVHSVTISGLTNGTLYHFAIKSQNEAGYSTITQDSAFVVGAAQNTISLTSPVAYQVFQRDSVNKSDIKITGIYNGAATAIEASFNGSPFTTIVTNPSGGAFSGTLPNMSGGQGTLTVRYVGNPASAVTVPYVGVGDIYFIAGQSNASGRGFTNQVYSHPTLKASLFGNDDGWKELVDPTDSTTGQIDAASNESVMPGGSAWPLLATYILADQSVPVAFIPGAKGGVPISMWSRSLSSTTLYGSMYRRINAVGGKVKAVLYFQGETDAQNGITTAAYLSAINDIANGISTDFGAKTVVGVIGNSGTAADRVDAIRQAQISAWNTNPNIVAGALAVDVDLSDESGDNLHFKSNADIAVFAKRWWAGIKPGLYGGSDDGRGPRLQKIEHNSGKTELTVTFTDSSPLATTSISPSVFTVKDDGVVATVSGVTRISDTKIKLTLSSAATGTITVSLASGVTGQNGGMPTDTSTYILPAEPFIGVVSVLETVTPPTGNTISDKTVSVTESSATISWTTSLPSSSQVTYTTSTSESNVDPRVTTHTITIPGLLACTTYRYQAISADGNNTVTSAPETTFTTSCPVE